MLESLTASYEHLFRAAIALVAALLAGYLFRRWWEDRRAKKKLAEAVKQELNVPQSLHPVIDPDICIGSGSCINACPEGKILGLVDGVATLVNASKCIGHGKCAAECPVSAIKLVFGSAERGVELPEVDEHFETSRPGVHIVGELAGMGLIKNALDAGPAGGRASQGDHRRARSRPTGSTSSSSARDRRASRPRSAVAPRA